MEIKNLNSKMLNAYKSVGSGASKGGKLSSAEEGKKGGGNVDKVEFDFARSIGAAKINIAAELAAGAGSARLEALQEAYEGDKMPVGSESVAESITG